MSDSTSARRTALRVTLIYVACGCLWILASDNLLLHMGLDAESVRYGQTLKGLLYVALTGLLIFVLVRSALARAAAYAERLRASEERFSGLLERLNEAVYRMSLPDGEYEYVGPAMSTVFGHPAESFIERSALIRDILHPSSADYFVEMWERLLAGDVPPTYEYDVIGADGETRSIVQSNTGIFDASGAIVAIEGCCSDVTGRKRAEAERRRLEDRIRQAEKLESLGLLAGGIAHDFNNLLLSMLGNADLALAELPGGAPPARSVEEIRRAALRAADLSNQMLAYSGRGRFVISELEIDELVRETGDLLEVNLPAGVRIEYDLAEGLPAVRVDGTQIRQVIMNLITNAGEACSDGGTIRIRTAALSRDAGLPAAPVSEGELEPGPCVLVEVSDSGVGMSPQTLQRIFDPFFSTKPTGRGLGLAAALGIVRGHGGVVQVESRPGEGSTFRLLLPAAGRAANPAPAPPPRGGSRGGRTILVVDDERTVLETTRRMLEKLGYTVHAAAGGREALELMAGLGGAVDLVLLDQTMPEMSGEAVLRALRRQDPGLPIVFTSGWSSDDGDREAGGSGASGFIQKPYTLADLDAALHAVLGAESG